MTAVLTQIRRRPRGGVPGVRVGLGLGLCLGLVGLAGCNALLGIDDQHLRADGGAPDDSASAADGATDGTGDAAGGGSIYRSAVLVDGPVMYVRFGESSGGIAHDEVGHTDGTYPASGADLRVPGALTNDPDTAIAFSGVSNVQFAAGIEFLDVAPFSVELWIKHDVTTPNGFVLDHESYPRQGWSLFVDDKGVYFERFGDVNASTAGQNALADGAWHHIVGTWDGSVQRLYVDAKLADARSNAVSIPKPVGTWTVGGQNCVCTNNFFTGALDELALYDRALAPDRIDAHFHAAGR
ncbi:MAG: hypothetical protein QOI41_1307 [Myxococcales bacterium]|nr:hypothetical protein [Myxococcales bacterium]